MQTERDQKLSTENAFKNIRLIYDGRFPHKVAQILPGDFYVSAKPMIAYTVLGSCISACVVDPIAKVGGMNHFMLAKPKTNGRYDSWGESGRYGSYAMEMLINHIMKLGGKKDRMEVKIFGGASLYKSQNEVGRNNAEWALDYLETEGFKLLNSDTGDVYPRKIYYYTETGRVLMKKIRSVRNDTILERERAYQKTLKVKEENADDITLF